MESFKESCANGSLVVTSHFLFANDNIILCGGVGMTQ